MAQSMGGLPEGCGETWAELRELPQSRVVPYNTARTC